MLATRQVKRTVAAAPVSSVTVSVTSLVPTVVGVPEIRPVELIVRPPGRPAAASVRPGPELVVYASVWRDAACPTPLIWAPIGATLTPSAIRFPTLIAAH